MCLGEYQPIQIMFFSCVFFPFYIAFAKGAVKSYNVLASLICSSRMKLTNELFPSSGFGNLTVGKSGSGSAWRKTGQKTENKLPKV